MGRENRPEVRDLGRYGFGAASLWVVTLMALQACSEPTFHFRGYSDRSSCRAVIDSELAAGAEFKGAFDEALPDGAGLVTELTGSILSQPVEIDVACYLHGSVSYVDYVSRSDEQDASTRAYETFSKELDDVFGEADEERFADRRGKTYLCDESAQVTLRQTRISETAYEVSLLVLPHPGDC
jgi:hypothetical protein